MAIEFRDVSQLEAVTALDDGAYILVVVDGVAKLISKANANFGGGGTKTVFKLDADISANPIVYTLLHTDGSNATPQEMYDAFQAGLVYIDSGGALYSMVTSVQYFGTADNVTGVKIYIGGETSATNIGAVNQ